MSVAGYKTRYPYPHPKCTIWWTLALLGGAVVRPALAVIADAAIASSAPASVVFRASSRARRSQAVGGVVVVAGVILPLRPVGGRHPRDMRRNLAKVRRLASAAVLTGSVKASSFVRWKALDTSMTK